MKKLKAILSFVFVLGIICLGFSFASNNYGKVNAFAYSSQIVLENSTFDMAGGTISNAIGDNGGAVYVGNGATFTMTGGKIKNCSATNGGAVYIANGGTFIFNGGTIENCVADLGYAIYVQAGGTLNYENNADGFTGCGEDEDLHIYAEEGATVIAPGTPINIYVDGGLSKTITAPAGATTYLLQESEMPLDYEHCCGYFLDSELRTTIKNDTIDLTSVGEEITFSPRTASASSDGINIYTRTADPSLFTFTTDGADGYILTKNSAVTYSGTEFNLIMPREYEDKTVTTIANSAFTRKFDSCGSVNITFSSEITEVPVSCFETGFGEENCNIKSINIHNNITSIGNYAFSYCIGFTGSLIIGDRVTSIGVCAFYYCFGLTGELIIPDSVTSIGDYAFYYCNGLTSVIIGNNVTSIGNYVFSDCSGLTSVTIGNSVTSIGDGAFRYCSGLTGELIMPNSVTSIGYEAFSSCSGLTGELIILDSVTSIGNSAFSSCSGLTSVTIGDSVTSIGSSAFYYCSGLTEVKVSSGNTVYEDRGKNAIIEKSTNTIIQGFSCTDLSVLEEVTSIGNSAFRYCSGLTGELIIPDSVTSIGNYAFQYCTGLTGVYIPSSVTSIGSYAFQCCTGLTGVYIPSSVTTISASGYYNAPFNGCSSGLVIYTDVANASSKPSGWGTYWNYYGSGKTLTVNYGYTLEQYKSEVGLTFAPNGGGEAQKDEDIEISQNMLLQCLTETTVDAIIEKREYVVLSKKQTKIA